MDKKNVTPLGDNWTLIDDGVLRMIDAHNYRVNPPKWQVGFSVSESHGEDTFPFEITRAVERLVDDILQDPHVKREVDRRISEARHEGYFGGLDEVYSGKRFEL